jgi:glucoamylase
MRQYFLQNINIGGQGGIVAAPDYDTPGGSYYYHWMRDGTNILLFCICRL